MATYEHEITAVNKLNTDWIPILNGNLFCSPSCGAGCKKSDYDKAVAESNEIARQLGEGWTVNVFENLGWYWKVEKGDLIVRSSLNGFDATLQFNYDQSYYFNAVEPDPRLAVQQVRNQLQSVISKLQRQFASSAIDPMLISTCYPK